MKNLFRYNYIILLAIIASLGFMSCEHETLEPVDTIDDGGGTLSSYKAYSLDSIAGQGLETYGRVVFWKALDGKTLVQLSMYNVGEDAEHMSAIFSGSIASIGVEMMTLYSVTNTGETYDPFTGEDDVDFDDDPDNDDDDETSLGFGEFSTSKYFVIDDADFYEGLETFDATVQIMMSTDNDMVIAAGDVGMNADPVEEN